MKKFFLLITIVVILLSCTFIINKKIHLDLAYDYQVFDGLLASVNGNIEIESDIELQ